MSAPDCVQRALAAASCWIQCADIRLAVPCQSPPHQCQAPSRRWRTRAAACHRAAPPLSLFAVLLRGCRDARAQSPPRQSDSHNTQASPRTFCPPQKQSRCGFHGSTHRPVRSVPPRLGPFFCSAQNLHTVPGYQGGFLFSWRALRSQPPPVPDILQPPPKVLSWQKAQSAVVVRRTEYPDVRGKASDVHRVLCRSMHAARQ